MELTQEILIELFESANEGILLVSERGLIRTANPSLCAMFGYQKGELEGESIEILIPTHLRETHVDHRANYFKHPQKRAMGRGLNLMGRRKTGQEFPVEVSLNHLHAHGQTLAIALVTDSTEKRNNERALMRALIEGQEKERKRIAADLHDGLGPLLSAVKLRLSSTQHAANETAELLDQAMREIRSISHNLLPGTLEDFGLETALDDLCSKLRVGGANVRYQLAGPGHAIPKEVQLSYYRIAQELLTNALRHANASQVEIQLVRHDESLLLLVEDDGKGFDPTTGGGGIGLRNVTSRAESIGAVLYIDSQAGRGTTVSVELPLTDLA